MQNNQIPFSNFPQNFNRTMQIVEPTYEQHIMKTPELNVTNGRIPQVLVIDSNDRNCNKYPKSNNYVYQLTKEYKDVISIELVQGCIPYTGYAINENNNKLFLQESLGETIEVVIPPGNYGPKELGQALKDQLDKLKSEGILNSIYTITPDSSTLDTDSSLNLQKFTIESDLAGGDNIFRLLNNCCPCGEHAPYNEHNSFINLNNIGCNDCDSCQVCRKNNCNEYIKKSISKKLGFDKVNYLFARGTITDLVGLDPTTVDLDACDSKFTEEFSVGDKISFPELIGTTFMVSKITSDTEMEITGSSGDISELLNMKDEIIGSKIFGNKYTSNFVWDLEDAKYIILEIENLENIDSNNKNIDDSFAVIFFTAPKGENNILSTGSTPRKGFKKYFNPPLSTLDRLRIKFLTADGELYDFNGRNHVLEFNILALNQPGRYNTLITT